MEHINEREWNAYLAGTCNSERVAWMKEHAGECPQCERRMQSIHALAAEMAQWKVNTAGHDISVRVTQAVLNEASVPHHSWHRLFIRYALRVAALILIGVILGYWAGNTSAQQYIAKRDSSIVEETAPSYLAAIDFQFASGLTWSVLSDNSSSTEAGQQ